MPNQNPLAVPTDSARGSSLLVPHELSVDHSKLHRLQHYRFRYHQSERAAWLRVLDHAEPKPSRRDRYRDCGSGAWLQHSQSRGGYRVRSNACRSRCCPVCRQRYARDLADRITYAMGVIYRHEWRFVTLTVKHTRAPLRQQLDFLRRSFRRLRQRKCWKKHAWYGYATIEIAYNADQGEWHPHLHILTRSEWLPRPEIVKAWETITHGSFIVDIRAVKTARRVAEYVTSYIAKPPPIDTYANDDLLIEYYQAIAQGRLLILFGKTRPPLPAKIEDGYPNDWLYTEPLDSVLLRYGRGDPAAAIILGQIGHIEDPYDVNDERAPPPCVGAEPLIRRFPFSR